MQRKDSEAIMQHYIAWKEKKSCFRLPDRHRRNLSPYLIQEATKELPCPNNIGAWTKRKLDSWQDYLNAYKTALDTAHIEVNAKNDSCEKQIQHFIEQLNRPDVRNYENKVQVYTPHFNVVFIKHKDSGSMDTIISLQYGIKCYDVVRMERAVESGAI